MASVDESGASPVDHSDVAAAAECLVVSIDLLDDFMDSPASADGAGRLLWDLFASGLAAHDLGIRAIGEWMDNQGDHDRRMTVLRTYTDGFDVSMRRQVRDITRGMDSDFTESKYFETRAAKSGGLVATILDLGWTAADQVAPSWVAELGRNIGIWQQILNDSYGLLEISANSDWSMPKPTLPIIWARDNPSAAAGFDFRAYLDGEIRVETSEVRDRLRKSLMESGAFAYVLIQAEIYRQAAWKIVVENMNSKHGRPVMECLCGSS